MEMFVACVSFCSFHINFSHPMRPLRSHATNRLDYIQPVDDVGRGEILPRHRTVTLLFLTRGFTPNSNKTCLVDTEAKDKLVKLAKDDSLKEKYRAWLLNCSREYDQEVSSGKGEFVRVSVYLSFALPPCLNIGQSFSLPVVQAPRL